MKKKQLKNSTCIIDDNDTHKYKSKFDIDSRILVNMDTQNIKQIYNFDVICDEVRTAENINLPIHFQLQVAPLLNGTSYTSTIEYIDITISRQILSNILNEFNRHL